MKRLSLIAFALGSMVLLGSLISRATAHNDASEVTSRESSDEIVESRVYDVADLVVFRDEKGRRFDDFEPLIDLLDDIQPTQWEHNGGRGSMRGASLGTAKVLLIVTTRDVHHEIAEVLSQIRAVAKKHKGGLPRRLSPAQRGAADKQVPSTPLSNQSAAGSPGDAAKK